MLSCRSGGSKGGARDAHPWGSKFFQFHAVFGKIWQNRMLAPPPEELAPPPRGNPGSATVPLLWMPCHVQCCDVTSYHVISRIPGQSSRTLWMCSFLRGPCKLCFTICQHKDICNNNNILRLQFCRNNFKLCHK